MDQIVRRKAGDFVGPKPEILAPAGTREAFLAALAAGADAIYCGLKSFSARMAAKNFGMAELAALTELAHRRKVKVYVTLNTLLKTDDLAVVGRQLDLLNRQVHPDALIVQDLALLALAKQAGFPGELHFSTLANVSMPQVLRRLSKTFGAQRVVLPRELNVEEIKQMAAACPADLGLEIFVHGALCYGVSGRCYWSSYLGGKSGLRGRCVQPCRRRYTHGGNTKRYFACQDFSLDVLVKVLAAIPQVRAWKIEGRKKGPHYVYYTVSAYQMLRDEGGDAQAKKSALELLAHALGRPGTHYYFLPQRPQNPIDTAAQSASGMLVGTVRGQRTKPYLEPRLNLLPDDKLRIGYEDDAWHQIVTLNKGVPKRGKFFFKPARNSNPVKGAPVFLIDRREEALARMIDDLSADLKSEAAFETSAAPGFTLRLPPGTPRQPRLHHMHVLRRPGRRIPQTSLALWLDTGVTGMLPPAQLKSAWWWLPPVIWPEEAQQWQELIKNLLRKGARRFVLNAPWQTVLFDRLDGLSLWAGPFCNLANPLAIRAFKLIGGQGVVVSPELGRADVEALAAKSVLPLGVVISGYWPFCVSRTLSEDIKPNQPFISPRGEQGWVRRYGGLFWVYPNWSIDLRFAQTILQGFGYRLFIHLDEPVPRTINIKNRPGRWNWDLGLK